MRYNELVRNVNDATPANVEVVLIEDDEVFVGGYFDPNWFENAANTPVIVEVRAPADAVVEDVVVNEIITTINHELVHNEQNEQGRFIEDWDGSYEDNPNEIEAYAREGDHEFYQGV